jgi:hypothetical protein
MKMSEPKSTSMTTSSTGKTEEHTVSGDKLLDKVKQIVRDGNARRITIKSDTGKVLMEIPLTIGVVGAVFAPMLAAVGALAAVLTECSIDVEREVPDAAPSPAAPATTTADATETPAND